MSYQRRKILRALKKQGAVILREGGEHTILRTAQGAQSSLPRHPQVDRHLARGIVRQLGLNWKQFEQDVL
jgi:predicted RNA binding protein YcfA (HicA-like mRNA interferase family)